MSLALAALELSGTDYLVTASRSGIIMIGAGRVAASVVMIAGFAAFRCFDGGSTGSTETCLNYLIKSRVFMSQATAPFRSPYIVRGP